MDGYTLSVVAAANALVMTFTMLTLYVASRRSSSLWHWTFSGLCFSVNLLLSVLVNHWSAPYWLVPALANGLNIAGHLLLYSGLRSHLKLNTPLSLMFAVVALVIVAHGFPILALPEQRFLTFYPIVGTLCGLTLFTLWRHRSAGRKLPFTILTLTTLLFLGQLLFRWLTTAMNLDGLDAIGEQWQQNVGTLALIAYISLSTTGLALLVFRDQELHLRALSNTDALTGCLNRRAMMQIATQPRRYPETMLLIDVDWFKKINDQFGHEAGDRALMHIAEQLKLLLRASDSIFRIGGEEFMLMLGHCQGKAALDTAERIRSHIANHPITYQQHRLELTVSIGLATTLSSSESWQHWFNRADTALYAAKQAGRNRTQLANTEPYNSGHSSVTTSKPAHEMEHPERELI